MAKPVRHGPGAAGALVDPMLETLRPIGPGDEAILYEIYASTRVEELAILDWGSDQKDAFLESQFTAQHAYYQEPFADADFSLILRDDRPIGLGSRLMETVLAEAEEAGKPVRIHVERYNPAFRFYDRLGFREISDQGVYLLMEWRPRSDP